jgi:hypothetical protein
MRRGRILDPHGEEPRSGVSNHEDSSFETRLTALLRMRG